METDLSLIEISDEDDSLLSLQQSPNGTVLISNDKPYFSCSPLLQIPRSTRSVCPRPPFLESPIEVTKGEEDTSKPSSSSCEDSKNNSANKENVNGNKDEAPKLSVEPQQMKRKKKGGGYNLRKSLAWNRAFFTEEGVLDPLELSMLSGEALSVIHEGRESPSSELDSGSASTALKALESNLFKKVPSSAPIEGRKVAGKMSPRLACPAREKLNPASAVKRKVLSAHDVNRGASKRSGCPRPVSSFSQKRTSNTNATKVTVKDSRISKPLATNNAPPVTSMTSRSSSSSASHLRRNFTSQPVAARKETEIKGTLTSIKNGPNDAKCGRPGKLINKPTSLLPRRNVVKVRAEHEIHSLSGVQLPQVSQADNSSEGPPDSIVSAAAHPLNDNDSNTGKIIFSSSQTACCYSANMQQTQPQIAKPSGLRMPSPSLGFFGQSKSSDCHNMLKRDTQPCNLLQSNIPSVKASVLNPIHQRLPRPSSDVSPCLSTTYSVASSVNAGSDGKINSDSGLRNVQKLALQLQFNSESSDIENHKRQLHDTGLKSLNHAEQSKRENSCIGNVGMRINDSKLPVQSTSCEQVEKDDVGRAVDNFLKSKDSTNAGLYLTQSVLPCHLSAEVEGPSATKNTFAKQQLEEGHYKSSLKVHNVSLESLNAAVNTKWDKTGSQVHDDQVSSMDEFKPTAQQAELKKPGACKLHPMSYLDSQNDTFCKNSKSPKKVNKDNIVNAAYDGLEEIDCGAASDNPSHCTDVGLKKDKTNGTDCLNEEMQAGDVQILSLDGTLLVESCKSFSNTSAADNWIIIENPSAKSGEQTQILNSCLGTEQLFQDNCEPPSDGCVLSGKCAKESQEKDFHQSVNSAESRTTDFGGEWGSSIASCSVLPVNQDYGFAAYPDNASKANVDNESVVESFKHDVKLYSEAHALALDNMGKSSSIISHNVAVKNFCSNGGDFSGSKLEKPNDIFQSSPVKQVEVASGMNNMIVHESVTDKKFDSSEKNLIFSAHYCEKDTAMLRGDCNDAMHDVREHAAEQAKLIKSCSHELEQVNQHDNVHDVPCCDGNRSFENVSTIGRSGFKISQGPQQFETMENEPAAVDNTIEETLIDDAPVQSTNESSLVGCDNSKTIMSLANKESLLSVEDGIKQPKEDLELQNLDSVMELVQKENQGSSLDDNLLLRNTSVEFHGKDIVETVSSATLEQHNGFPNASKSFDACLCSPHMLQDINADRSEEYQSVEPSFENAECFMDCDYRNDYKLNNRSCSLNVASSSNSEENQILVAEKTPASKSSCSLNEKTIVMSNGSIQKDVQEDILKNNILPSEGEFNIRQSNGSTVSELRDGLCFIVHPEVVKEVTFSHNMSGNDNKQDSPAIRPPPNAVPFSDEWLSAFEAAGEEILAKKGGAVQNSPPDKALPEPGPWSPVKRKNNQEIGPFDCTKFTNPNIPPSTSTN